MIEQFGEFLQDSTYPSPNDEDQSIPNRFSWIINVDKYHDLDRFSSISNKLRTISTDDPTNRVHMDKEIEPEVVKSIVQRKLRKISEISSVKSAKGCKGWCIRTFRPPVSEEKMECHYYIYDMR